jgi:hypothetical protein
MKNNFTLTASASPEELADHWQRVANHFDLLLDRPEAVDALEQAILHLAVRGLLVPQEPSDEPASVLLQRMRAIHNDWHIIFGHGRDISIIYYKVLVAKCIASFG